MIDELRVAQEYKDICDKWMADLVKPLSEPLTVDENGYIQTGVVWIGLTCPPRKRVVKPKHACPSCGASHAIKGGGA